MNYKEEYEKALEKAKGLADFCSDNELKTLKYVFPELKESEDERIIKALISILKSYFEKNTIICGISVGDIIAWLEKQNHANSAKTCKDEQNTVVVIPKFRIGDEIKTSNEESLTITKIDDKGYWSKDLFICDFDEECLWDLVEQKPTDKVEPKFHGSD